MQRPVPHRAERCSRPPRPGSFRRLGFDRLLVTCLLLVAVFACPLPAEAAASSGPQRVDAVEVELVAERTAVRAGESVLLGLRLRHDPHWHTYWRNPGDSGLATQVEPRGPEGSDFGPLRWPAPARFWVGPLANYGYEDEVVLPFAARLPASLPAGPVRFEVHAQWLVCKDVCIPGEARLALDLPLVAVDGPEPARSRQAGLFEAMARRIPDPQRPLVGIAHREGARLSLRFPAPSGVAGVSTAEFFPHPEGVVSAPAPQALLRTQDGWRIDLELVEGAVPPDTIDGLLVADGAPYAFEARLAAGSAPQGEPVSVSDRPAGSSRGSGLLAALGGSSGGAPSQSTGSPGATGTAAGGSLALALLFGAIGGAILNLMPCVFPVVGLKVLGFANAAADPRDGSRAMRRGAFVFAAGVLVSFWALAGLMLVLREAGEAIGWGFQLQSPGFVALMALLFVVVGLNFSGVYEIGLTLTRLGGVGGSGSGWGSFGAGVLAVLVATPCTAPFMGSALGFTLTQPPAFTMAVFTAIGVGMALPYLLLGLFPGWIRRLPRPGRWMETLRQALAFPMYATAAWLAWVLVQQAGADAMLRLLLASVAIGAALWAWGRWANGSPRRPGVAAGALIAGVAAVATLLGPVVQADPAPSARGPLVPSGALLAGGAWETWSEERVAAARAAGRTVFVDFTAAWCVSCQANKKLVLERTAVADAMRAAGVVTLRADWTQRDPAITAALARHGRNGVPLYLVYRPGEAAPRVLPELLTVGLVLEAIR